MKKYLPIIAVVLAIIIIASILFVRSDKDMQGPAKDHKNATYTIDGAKVTLEDGVSGMTSYFGNELRTDLNNDGREDIVFLVTQENGRTGMFFYVVAALDTPEGFVGSDGYPLGDRIAPQNITNSPNPRHKNVVVVNYADQSVGKSAYLKLDVPNMQWGIVEADFEGESR